MGLKESIQNECVRDLPVREPILLRPDTPVSAAIEAMREKQLGCAFVVDEEGKPIGKFSERIVIDLLLHQPDDLDAITVQNHLDPEWFTVRQDDKVSKVFEAIQKHAARFLCVIDDDGRVIGLTGQKGMSEYIADHFPRQVMVQRVGGKPGMETREGA
jgi:CBS domain-containing protein